MSENQPTEEERQPTESKLAPIDQPASDSHVPPGGEQLWVPTREEILDKLARMAHLIATDVLKPDTANSMLGVYQTILDNLGDGQ